MTRFNTRVLAAIASCESGSKQFEDDGITPKRGKVNPKDVGFFQINEDYWLASSTANGIDIYTEAGNRAFAWRIYESFGTQPWSASEWCWRPKIEVREPPNALQWGLVSLETRS